MERSFKAVIFDLAGTLVRQTDAPIVFRRILCGKGIVTKLREVRWAFEATSKAFTSRTFMHMTIDEYFEELNARILWNLGVRTNVRDLARHIDKYWFRYAKLKPYAETVEVLARLKDEKYRLAIVSNIYQADLDRILRRFQLRTYFDAAVAADKGRSIKPNPKIYQLAVRLIETKPCETLYVGDDPTLDYGGAKRAGLQTLLLSRSGRAPSGFEMVRNLRSIFRYLRASS